MKLRFRILISPLKIHFSMKLTLIHARFRFEWKDDRWMSKKLKQGNEEKRNSCSTTTPYLVVLIDLKWVVGTQVTGILLRINFVKSCRKIREHVWPTHIIQWVGNWLSKQVKNSIQQQLCNVALYTLYTFRLESSKGLRI